MFEGVLTEEEQATLLETMLDQSYRYSGAGSAFYSYQAHITAFDRFSKNLVYPNHETAGLVFMTRPKLNFSTPSLRSDRILANLATLDESSINFSIRCTLDTAFAWRSDNRKRTANAAYFNGNTPVIPAVTNACIAFSGAPDLNMDVETTEGGLFGENQTFAKGADDGNGTTELSLTFRDINGGYLSSLFIYWFRYIQLATRGVMTAYADDIAARRLNYTCSIYRFTLDPSRKHFMRWAKGTGCFIRSFPLGQAFNFNDNEDMISNMATFSVPFVCNHWKYLDPAILQDFNIIAEQFAPFLKDNTRVRAGNRPEHNFAGIPYLGLKEKRNELLWMCDPEELKDPVSQIFEETKALLMRRLQAAVTQQEIIDAAAQNATATLA